MAALNSYRAKQYGKDKSTVHAHVSKHMPRAVVEAARAVEERAWSMEPSSASRRVPASRVNEDVGRGAVHRAAIVRHPNPHIAVLGDVREDHRW